jgi:hypothetical protein
MFAEVLGSQYADHASINLRRFSSASHRRYACSALSPMTSASAVSVINRGPTRGIDQDARKPINISKSMTLEQVLENYQFRNEAAAREDRIQEGSERED